MELQKLLGKGNEHRETHSRARVSPEDVKSLSQPFGAK